MRIPEPLIHRMVTVRACGGAFRGAAADGVVGVALRAKPCLPLFRCEVLAVKGLPPKTVLDAPLSHLASPFLLRSLPSPGKAAP